MNKFLTALFFMLLTVQSANAMTVDAFLDKHLTPLSDFVSNIIFFPIHVGGTEIPIVVLWVLIGGLFFSFYLRGIAGWGLSESLKILKTPAKKNSEGGGGEVSPLQSLMTALSGTVGLGQDSFGHGQKIQLRRDRELHRRHSRKAARGHVRG